MEITPHTHQFAFNDDGFQVCVLCGLCSSLREYHFNAREEPVTVLRSNYADVLINHNIGYVGLVEEEYKKMKTLLRRGYSNKALYAYCTYNILLKNNVYYSLSQISNMFSIVNFSRLFCQIEKNKNIKSQYTDVREEKYVESSLYLFLSEYGHKTFFRKAVEFSREVRKIHKPLKLSFLASVSIFMALKETKVCPVLLQHDLATHFSINIRTFKALLKNVGKALNQK